MASNCIPKLTGGFDTVILKTNKVNAKLYANDDIVIVLRNL